MSDLISRKAAIEALESIGSVDTEADKEFAIEIFEALPSVQERKARWIHREDMDFLDENKVKHIHFMCSECGLIHDFLDGHTSQYNYCPNCGCAMMEGAEE